MTDRPDTIRERRSESSDAARLPPAASTRCATKNCVADGRNTSSDNAMSDLVTAAAVIVPIWASIDATANCRPVEARIARSTESSTIATSSSKAFAKLVLRRAASGWSDTSAQRVAIHRCSGPAPTLAPDRTGKCDLSSVYTSRRSICLSKNQDYLGAA
jgi:hypothetical protein